MWFYETWIHRSCSKFLISEIQMVIFIQFLNFPVFTKPQPNPTQCAQYLQMHKNIYSSRYDLSLYLTVLRTLNYKKLHFCDFFVVVLFSINTILRGDTEEKRTKALVFGRRNCVRAWETMDVSEPGVSCWFGSLTKSSMLLPLQTPGSVQPKCEIKQNKCGRAQKSYRQLISILFVGTLI